jgi:glycosyltransferase involved in cell wall biosynthesis
MRLAYPYVIGWTGTAGNLKYLEGIEEPIGEFLRHHRDWQLWVVADEPPSFRKIPANRFRFIRWSPDTEALVVQRMQIGLMPLQDNEWTRGKCSFKMLQYMASGVPCIVSPVGMNADILKLGRVGLSARNEDEWYEALLTLSGDSELAHTMGSAGRTIAEQYFDTSVVGHRLAQVLMSLIRKR